MMPLRKDIVRGVPMDPKDNPFAIKKRVRKAPAAAVVAAPAAPKKRVRKAKMPTFVEKASALAGDYLMTLPRKGRSAAADVVSMPAEPTGLTITLEPDLAKTLTELSEARGVDVQTLVRVGLRNLVQRTNFYSLCTPLAFGKYRGETMETVVRCDPSYVDWMIKTSTTAEFSEVVLDLLKAVNEAGRPT